MANKTRDELIADIRIELEDSTIWAAADLNQAIEDTVSMLSRLKPKGNIQDKVVPASPTAETLTMASGTGTLAIAPAKPKSESIKNSEGTVLTKDTNYTINYITGVVTAVTGMDDGDYTASYTIHPYFVKVTDLSDTIKIQSVEYPAGEVPASFPGFDQIQDWLVVKLGAAGQLSPGSHIHIHTLEEWIQPAASTGGDYPPHLDQAVITGSVGNALLNKSRKYRWLAAAALADCNTAIGNISVSVAVGIDSVVTVAAPADVTTSIAISETDYDTVAGLLATAIAAIGVSVAVNLDSAVTVSAPTDVTTTMTISETDFDTATALLDTAIAAIGVSVAVGIDSVVTIAAPTDVSATISLTTTDFDTIMAKIDAAATGLALVQDFLDAGDDYINVVNIGKEVAALYAQYAAKEIDKNVSYLAQVGKLLELEVSKAQAAVETVKTEMAREEHLINVGRAQVEAINAQIADAGAEIATARASSEAYDQQAQRLVAQVGRILELEASKLHASIETAKTKIAYEEHKIAVGNAQIAAMNTQIADAQAEIATGVATSDGYNQQAQRYVEQLGKILDLEMSKAQAAVESAKTAIAYEEHKVAVGRAQIEAVRVQIEDANAEIATAQATAAAYVQQAEKYLAEAMQYNELGDKMASEGKELVNQFVNQVASKFEGVTSLSAQPGKA